MKETSTATKAEIECYDVGPLTLQMLFPLFHTKKYNSISDCSLLPCDILTYLRHVFCACTILFHCYKWSSSLSVCLCVYTVCMFVCLSVSVCLYCLYVCLSVCHCVYTVCLFVCLCACQSMYVVSIIWWALWRMVDLDIIPQREGDWHVLISLTSHTQHSSAEYDDVVRFTMRRRRQLWMTS